MGSDRARISYDAKQQYRSVVAQQGRVTLEADSNEAQQIISEELREETLDFVGSSGTPDDGYRVIETGTRVIDTESSTTPPFDFSVQSGTMYVGGIRAFLGDPAQPIKQLFKYSDQTKTDWLNYKNDPDWIDSPKNSPPSNEFIYLYLREQEVSAVEDSALLDPALGGPDTTQRTRLIQHIVRLSIDGKNCSSALETAVKAWNNKGLNFEPKTMRLMSPATLKVETIESAPPSDPCDPAARGGYLGAENQLIRVQISGFDSAKNQYKFVWGFDNASFLYRVKAKNNTTENNTTNTTLQLQSQPVDDFHRPRQGQTVEMLRSAAKLSNGEYVASATGFVTKLAAPYDPVSQEITLPSFPNEYLDASQTPQLFLRVWEEEKPFESGKSVILGDTGLQVTLQTSGNLPFHVGDYWIFAVRPTTPTEVYPKHYLEAPQPPDGPSLWVCPLAVIQWNTSSLKVLEDCRQPFDNLVELTKRKFGGGCCTVTVRPEDLKQGKTLQSILEQFKNRERVTICLMPGNYQLSEPLVLGSEHSNLTLEGCHDGVVLEAAPGTEKEFLQGLVVLNRANNVTFRRLRFHLPQVPFFEAGGKIAGLKKDSLTSYLPRLLDLRVSIGIRPLHCAVLTVEDCLFRYSLTKGADVFGVGIFAGSECWGLKVQNCRFLHEEEYLRGFQEPLRMLIGYLLAPSLSLKAFREEDIQRREKQSPAGFVLRSLLQDATFNNNLFVGLTFATLIMADTGVVKIENNTVRECYSGFWLMTLRALSIRDDELRERIGALADVTIQLWGLIQPKTKIQTINRITQDIIPKLLPWVVLQLIQEPVTYLTIMLSQSYPLPPAFKPREAVQVPKPSGRTRPSIRLVESLTEQANAIFGSPTQPTSNAEIPNTNTSATILNLSAFATQETVGFAKKLGDRLEALKLAGLQQLVKIPLQLSLDFSQNAVDVLVKDAPSGTPLFIWDTDQQTQSMMTMSRNRLRNQTSQTINPRSTTDGSPFPLPLPTVAILQVDRCTVTGNLVLNESVFKVDENKGTLFFSIILLPREIPDNSGGYFHLPIAITGNVFKGLPILPTRDVIPDDVYSPLNFWSPTFNTQTW